MARRTADFMCAAGSETGVTFRASPELLVIDETVVVARWLIQGPSSRCNARNPAGVYVRAEHGTELREGWFWASKFMDNTGDPGPVPSLDVPRTDDQGVVRLPQVSALVQSWAVAPEVQPLARTRVTIGDLAWRPSPKSNGRWVLDWDWKATVELPPDVRESQAPRIYDHHVQEAQEVLAWAGGLLTDPMSHGGSRDRIVSRVESGLKSLDWADGMKVKPPSATASLRRELESARRDAVCTVRVIESVRSVFDNHEPIGVTLEWVVSYQEVRQRVCSKSHIERLEEERRRTCGYFWNKLGLWHQEGKALFVEAAAGEICEFWAEEQVYWEEEREMEGCVLPRMVTVGFEECLQSMEAMCDWSESEDAHLDHEGGCWQCRARASPTSLPPPARIPSLGAEHRKIKALSPGMATTRPLTPEHPEALADSSP
jgi:hypothetical protein